MYVCMYVYQYIERDVWGSINVASKKQGMSMTGKR